MRCRVIFWTNVLIFARISNEVLSISDPYATNDVRFPARLHCLRPVPRFVGTYLQLKVRVANQMENFWSPICRQRMLRQKLTAALRLQPLRPNPCIGVFCIEHAPSAGSLSAGMDALASSLHSPCPEDLQLPTNKRVRLVKNSSADSGITTPEAATPPSMLTLPAIALSEIGAFAEKNSLSEACRATLEAMHELHFSIDFALIYPNIFEGLGEKDLRRLEELTQSGRLASGRVVKRITAKNCDDHLAHDVSVRRTVALYTVDSPEYIHWRCTRRKLKLI